MNSNKPTDRELAGDAFAIVLAGGNGTRLGELTRWQCKPAISFAGHFRNIDFTLSNCVNSGIRRIAVLTQYKAQSLITHLAAGWSFLPRSLGEFVEVWPAQQRIHKSWYAGTADAVHQNLDLLAAQRKRYTLVLAGDHIYKMNYVHMLNRHAQSGADVTVACVPVPRDEAHAFGVLSVDRGQRVRSFIEKPAPESFSGGQATVLASMGVYVFTTDYLIERLIQDASLAESAHDFGRDILPSAVRSDHVGAFAFTQDDGAPAYWRDVGTVDAYWQAHMELLALQPPIDLDDPAWPIMTSTESLPPARLLLDSSRRGSVSNSLLAGGVLVRGAQVSTSVLSSCVQVAEGSTIEQAVILPGARVGAGCLLRRVIVDVGTRIPDGTVVAPDSGVTLLSGDPIPEAGSWAGLRSVA